MSSFSTRKLPDTLFALFLALILAAPARADDRMAGTGPGVHKTETKKEEKEEKSDKKPADDKSEETPAKPEAKTYPVNYTEIESAGILSNPEGGWLGVDLWTGSQHASLVKLIGDVPNDSPYRILNDLKRRALLSETDANLMYGRSAIEPGRDLLTVRIEKLNAMGAYGEAAHLYTAINGDPYHENLAESGITAMLMDGQVSLGCLEANAMKPRFNSSNDFWNTVIPACAYLLAKDGGTEPPANLPEPPSAVISRMIKRDNFRTDIRKLDDLRELKPLEQGLLMADGRLSYGNPERLEIKDMTPSELGLLVHEKNLDEEFRFRIMIHMVDSGLRDISDLESFYETVPFAVVANKEENLKAYDSVTGWRRLAFLYQSAKAARANNALAGKVSIKALKLHDEYGIAALLPFAQYLKYAIPEDVSDDLIRPGLRVASEKSAELPAFWLKKWESLKKLNKEDLLISSGFDISSNLSTLLMPKIPDSKAKESPINAAESGLFTTIYEKLDKKSRVVKYSPSIAYEKQIDLTADSGYVMPSTGLINDFDKAVRERRLGEVVFLSTILLDGSNPGNTNAGLIRKVMDGLETVGLTFEAREFAREVISRL